MAACSAPQDVVATIDGEAITKTEVKVRIKSYQEEHGDETSAPVAQQSQFTSAKAALNQIINERLLLLEARRQGLIDDRKGDPQSYQIAMQKVLCSLGKEVSFPNLQEARVFYEKHPEEFIVPVRYQLKHLLLNSEHTAWKLKEEIDKGLTSMTDAGRQEIFGARIADSGKNRLITAAELPPGLAEMLPNLKPKVISPVITTPYGYHLVRVEKTFPSGNIPFPEVENRIKDTIFSQRLQNNYQHWLKQIKEQHTIKIFHQHLADL